MDGQHCEGALRFLKSLTPGCKSALGHWLAPFLNLIPHLRGGNSNTYTKGLIFSLNLSGTALLTNIIYISGAQLYDVIPAWFCVSAPEVWSPLVASCLTFFTLLVLPHLLPLVNTTLLSAPGVGGVLFVLFVHLLLFLHMSGIIQFLSVFTWLISLSTILSNLSLLQMAICHLFYGWVCTIYSLSNHLLKELRLFPHLIYCK